MKKTQKVLSLILAVALLLAIGTTAMAATITINNAENGVKYTLYKLFDAVESNGGYTYSLMSVRTNLNHNGTSGEDWFEIYDTDKVKAVMDGNNPKLTPDIMNSNSFKNWAKTYGVKAGEDTGTGSAVVFNDMATGYYFMETDRPGQNGTAALITVDTVTENMELEDKNLKPGWKDEGKAIVEGGNEIKTNEVSLEETIKFKISINAKNKNGDKKIYRYIITDSLDNGMTYKTAPEVSIGGTVKTVNTDYTITYKDKSGAAVTDLAKAQSFRIEIPWTDNDQLSGTHKYGAATDIIINYDGEVDALKAADAKYSAANDNKAKFTWLEDGDTPGTGPDPQDPDHHIPESKTETFTTEIVVNKKDGNNAVLTGAEFTLTNTGNNAAVAYVQGRRFVQDNANGTYWLLKDGTYTTTSPSTPGVDANLYATPTTNKYKLETYKEVQGGNMTEPKMNGYVDADGKVKFSGLGEGTYKLTESVVPVGYNKAADVTFTVKFDPALKKFYVEGANSPVAPHEVDDGSGTMTHNNAAATLSVDIVNNTGAELPETGGIGTTIFYAVGSVLLLGAAVLMVTRRRMKTEK